MSWIQLDKTSLLTKLQWPQYEKKLTDAETKQVFFREDDQFYYVPRCCCSSSLLPQINHGETLSSDLTFQGQLEQTASRPQKAAVEAIQQAFQKWPFAGILELPPGTGKTVIAIAAALLLGRKTIICVHTSVLFAQWKERIATFAPSAKIGTIRGKKWDTEGADIVIAMLQTLYRRKKNSAEFGTIIVDEVHHVAAKTFFSAAMDIPTQFMLGLSATPKRNDGLTRILHYVMGPTIFKADIVLAPNTPRHVMMLRYENPSKSIVALTFAASREYERMYFLKKLSRDRDRNYMIRDHIIELASNPARQILILSHFVAHLEFMKDLVAADGLTHLGLLCGTTKMNQRQEIVSDSRLLFATYALVKEGFDSAKLNTLVLMLPAGNIIQTAGRIMRSETSETTIHILDIVDPVYHLFEKMAYGRRNFYKKRGFQVQDKSYDPLEGGLVLKRKESNDDK